MSDGSLPKHWSSLGGQWTVDLSSNRFVPPRRVREPGTFLIAKDEMKDGWISGRLDFSGDEKKEAAFIIRYEGEESGYIAGMGWDSKFFIGAMIPGDRYWKFLKGVGSAKDIKEGISYRLQVRFKGPEIILLESGVEQARVSHKKYKGGHIGLFAFSAAARFRDVRVAQKQCFVVMPFARKFNYVYRDIREAVESLDLVCIRSDENKRASPIMTEVIEQIKASDLVIVDLTDQNANVYYEAGLAHAFRKRCIILARSEADVKFDLQHIRTFFYGRRRNRLKTELAKWIEESQAGVNPRR